MRRETSLRIGVHRANAVVWGPVYRTHLAQHQERLEHLRVQRRARALGEPFHERLRQRLRELRFQRELHGDDDRARELLGGRPGGEPGFEVRKQTRDRRRGDLLHRRDGLGEGHRVERGSRAGDAL